MSQAVALPLGAARTRAPSVLSRARALILARGASAAVSFVIPLALARLLDSEQYGTYRQLILVAQTIYMIVPFGMAQSLYYFIPRVQERRAYLVQTLAFMAGVGGLSGVALVAFGPALANALHNPDLALLRVPLALYTAGLVASYPLEVALTADGRTQQAAWTYVISDGLRIAAMTLPVVAGTGLRGLCWALAALMVARTAAALMVLLPGQVGALLDGPSFKAQWVYAVPFGFAMAIAVPQQYFHQYAVSASVGAAAFAVYSVGCFQLPVVDLLYTPTSEILMVRIAELDASGRLEEAATLFREASGKLFLIFCPLAAFLFAAAPDFISALFTERYIAAVPILRIALVCLPMASFPVDGVLRARNKTRIILMSYVVKAAVAVPLVLLGVKTLGIIGAILAWVVGEILGKALLLANAPDALGTRMDELLPFPEMSHATVGSMLGGVAVVLARRLVPAPTPLVHLAMDGAVFTLVYAATLQLRGISPGGWWLPSFAGEARGFSRRRAVPTLAQLAPTPSMDRGTPTTMFNAIQIYRVARYLHLRNVPVLPRLLRKTIQYLHGSYLPPEADIGEGVELGYGGLGVIIHPRGARRPQRDDSPQVTLGGGRCFEGRPRWEAGW